MIKECGVERVFGVLQLLTERGTTKIGLLVAKGTDDFLVSGEKEDVKNFTREVVKDFTVGRYLYVGRNFTFIGFIKEMRWSKCRCWIIWIS